MTEESSESPTGLRQFVAYRPPFTQDQATRAPTRREIWADVCRFLERVAKPSWKTGTTISFSATRWSAESTKGHKEREFYGEWPSECSVADFEAAVTRATELFGKPAHEASEAHLTKQGLETQLHWNVSVQRANDVLDFVDAVSNCTGGGYGGYWPPIHVWYSCLFRLRDLSTGRPLPGQGDRLYPLKSTLSIQLGRPGTGHLVLILPLAQPEGAAEYVVALQEFAPVWIDPRYFDLVTRSADGSRFERERLPVEWIGRTADGELRLDASRSGLIPSELPTDTEIDADDAEVGDRAYVEMFGVVEAALLAHRTNAMVIRAPDQSVSQYMVEQAAKRLDMPVHVVSTESRNAPTSFADQLRSLVGGLDHFPAVILVELHPMDEEMNKAVLLQAPTRVVEGVHLPPDVRLVLSEGVYGSVESQLAGQRYDIARQEHFASPRQLQYLRRLQARAGYRAMTLVQLPIEANKRRV